MSGMNRSDAFFRLQQMFDLLGDHIAYVLI
jgi:hypothetical protein